MQLIERNDIENNIFSTEVTIGSFGDESWTEDMERELLRDFPTKITYRQLDFERKFIANGTTPVIDDNGDIVKLNLTNQEILFDEHFRVVYKVDCSKIPISELTEELTTKEMVAQAKCMTFADVIETKLQEVLNELKTKAPLFTGEIKKDI